MLEWESVGLLNRRVASRVTFAAGLCWPVFAMQHHGFSRPTDKNPLFIECLKECRQSFLDGRIAAQSQLGEHSCVQTH